MKTLFTSSVFLSASLSLAFAQRDFSGVEIRSTHVGGKVYMLEGSGGNIGVSAGEDGVLIVDDQFAPLAEKIEAAIRKINPGSLKFLLNTHWHGDHTGGNAHFGKKASIVAHSNVRKRLADAPGAARESLPVLTFDQSVSVHFNGEEIRVIHLPTGHTDGDSVIHFTKSGVVHMGDHFFNGRFPFIDLNSGGDVKGYLKNVESVLQHLPDGVKIIPGHGALATRGDLETFHAALVETTGIVKRGIDAGKKLEDLKAAGLPDKWKDWGSGFVNTDRWIETVYNSFTRN
ncbi:MAG: MBL fold metallo-hydrolase [Verrucomicrobia bacterium]|nr:MBL fold metallo-hydrolase [Verrucomicrobiota bacterium]